MADPLWTIGEAIAACGGRPDGEMDQGAALSSVSIDTRTLEPGALYVAIRKHCPTWTVRFGPRDVALVAAALTAVVIAFWAITRFTYQ